MIYSYFVGLGVSHMAVVDATGSLFIWGSNEHGKLGHSNVEDRSSKFYSPLQQLP